MKNDNTEGPTLEEIQKSISSIDKKRALKRLTSEQREALEMSAVGLREAERLAIARLQKQIVDEMTARTAELNRLSKRIRARITRMNKFPKGVAKVETVLTEAARILLAVARWR